MVQLSSQCWRFQSLVNPVTFGPVARGAGGHITVGISGSVEMFACCLGYGREQRWAEICPY